MVSQNGVLSENEFEAIASENRSALKFFVLIFVLTIPLWVVSALTQIELLPALPVSAIAVVCPMLAAFILIYRKQGIEGVKALLKRSFDFKRVKEKIWYAPTLLLMPVIMILSYATQHMMGVQVPAPQFSAVTVIVLFALFMISAVFEELGWSGYITDPLQNRFGALGAVLMIGVVWAGWHVIGLLSVQRSLAFIAWWGLGTVASRVIIVWLYNNTGRSVFIAALFHAISNLTWQLFPIDGSFYDPSVTAPITAAVAIIAILVWKPKTLAHDRSARLDQAHATR